MWTMSLEKTVNVLLNVEVEASRKADPDLIEKVAVDLTSMSSGDEEEPGMANVEKNGVCDGKLHGKNTPEARTLEKGQTVSPGKGSREAREAASRSDEKQETMDDEARRSPEELAEVKTGLKEIVATAKGEMLKALAVKDEVIEPSDRARACFQAAERETAKKEARAATAEHQLSRSTENARLLRTRLEEMAAELEVARSAISNMTEADRVREDVDKPVGERLVREAFEGQVPIAFESADEVASVRDAAEKARHRADQLQAELDLVNQEAGKLREALEGARELHRLAEKREVDSTNLVEEAALLAARNELEKAKKDCEIHSLKVRLEQSEEALREAKMLIASMEESTRREASLKPAALEERKGEGEACKVAVTEVVDPREEAERLAAENNSARDGELNSLREGLEILRAELAGAKALASTARENAAAAEAATASRIAGLEARLEGAEAAQELKAAHRLEATVAFVKSEEVEVKGWRDKAERAVRETQAERNRAMEAAVAADPAREGMILMEHEPEEEAAEAAPTAKQDDDDGDDDHDDDEKEKNEKEKSSKKRKSKEAENDEAKKANTREKTTIYVKGLPWDTPDEEVKNFFKACGKIESIEQPKGSGSRFLGAAFVTFDNIAAALKAIEMDGQELGGRWLKIAMAIQKPKPDGCKRVFIGNLSWSIDEYTVRQTFGECGDIKSVCFGEDRKTGEFRGFGYVEFFDASCVDAAVELSGLDVMGRPIRVIYAEPPRPPRENSSGGGRSGGRGGGAAGRGGGGLDGGRSEEHKGKKCGEREGEGGSVGHEDEGERGEGRQGKDEGVGCEGGGEKDGERKRKKGGERKGEGKGKKARRRQDEGESEKGVGRDDQDKDGWMGREGKKCGGKKRLAGQVKGGGGGGDGGWSSSPRAKYSIHPFQGTKKTFY